MKIPKVGTPVAITFIDPMTNSRWIGSTKREDSGLDGHVQIILGVIMDSKGKEIIIASCIGYSTEDKQIFDMADVWRISKGAIRFIHQIELPPESYQD